VDAGVFPMSVAGHSSSSVYAVAEKVSSYSWIGVRGLRDAVADLVIGGRYYQSSLEVAYEVAGCRVERCFPNLRVPSLMRYHECECRAYLAPR
jgi:hypothetical protein